MDPVGINLATREGPESPSVRKRILVCDDEPNMVRLIQVNLEHHGYEVVTAVDGKEALEKLRVSHPDAVLLDVMMPYVDGLEVLKSIRRNPETEHLCVIMLTVKAQDGDIFEGYNLGADVYLTKPFNPDELLRILQSAL